MFKAQYIHIPGLALVLLPAVVGIVPTIDRLFTVDGVLVVMGDPVDCLCRAEAELGGPLEVCEEQKDLADEEDTSDRVW